jgi:hypothetical protein
MHSPGYAKLIAGLDRLAEETRRKRRQEGATESGLRQEGAGDPPRPQLRAPLVPDAYPAPRYRRLTVVRQSTVIARARPFGDHRNFDTDTVVNGRGRGDLLPRPGSNRRRAPGSNVDTTPRTDKAWGESVPPAPSPVSRGFG